jgi:hypothetical protein
VRASDFNGKLGAGQQPRVEDGGLDESGKVVLPNGAIGFRWGRTAAPTKASGTWKPRKPATATRSSSSCR